ncbi:hypothetical protein MMC30_005611 [Trapelia coarctata]|nr:hypothetical protein [Trapelia coarctata]
MDPLSVTASIVAIVGAGGSLASGLRKIYALKDAPDDLRQLYEELSEIRLLVSAIQEACRQRGNRVPVEDECDEFIYVTLKRSRDEVLGVEKLIAYDLTKVTSNGDELNKMAWMRARSQVQSAQARLRDTRSRLTGILNV